jgi:hypothetical protein
MGVKKIPSKFLDAVQSDQEFPVEYRWGETYEGQTDWTDWDKGLLIFLGKANDKDEPGVSILDEPGWGYAGRDKTREDVFGKTIFVRYSEGESQKHLLQVRFD